MKIILYKSKNSREKKGKTRHFGPSQNLEKNLPFLILLPAGGRNERVFTVINKSFHLLHQAYSNCELVFDKSKVKFAD